MRRLHVLLASAVLLGFALPHCTATGLFMSRALAAPIAAAERTRDAACPAHGGGAQQGQRDCCAGCPACLKGKEFPPFGNKEPEQGGNVPPSAAPAVHCNSEIGTAHPDLQEEAWRPLFELA